MKHCIYQGQFYFHIFILKPWQTIKTSINIIQVTGMVYKTLPIWYFQLHQQQYLVWSILDMFQIESSVLRRTSTTTHKQYVLYVEPWEHKAAKIQRLPHQDNFDKDPTQCFEATGRVWENHPKRLFFNRTLNMNARARESLSRFCHCQIYWKCASQSAGL